MKQVSLSTFKIASFLFIAVLFHACQSDNKDIKIDNPFPVEFGDPYILKASDGMYYMVGTGGVSDGFKMYSSADLKNWKDEGRIYQGKRPESWNMANFWAPDACKIYSAAIATLINSLVVMT